MEGVISRIRPISMNGNRRVIANNKTKPGLIVIIILGTLLLVLASIFFICGITFKRLSVFVALSCITFVAGFSLCVSLFWPSLLLSAKPLVLLRHRLDITDNGTRNPGENWEGQAGVAAQTTPQERMGDQDVSDLYFPTSSSIDLPPSYESVMRNAHLRTTQDALPRFLLVKTEGDASANTTGTLITFSAVLRPLARTDEGNTSGTDAMSIELEAIEGQTRSRDHADVSVIRHNCLAVQDNPPTYEEAIGNFSNFPQN